MYVCTFVCTITAPPSIICSTVCRCNEAAKTRLLPLKEATVYENVRLHVQVRGVGPFTFRWLHKDKVMNCSNDASDTTGNDVSNCTVSKFSNLTYGHEVP